MSDSFLFCVYPHVYVYTKDNDVLWSVDNKLCNNYPYTVITEITIYKLGGLETI